MALQTGNIKIKGKLNGQSYFYSRDGGYQLRELNPTISTRVKTEDGYLNTRLFAREFGSCGNFASKISPVSYTHLTLPTMAVV